MREYEILLNKLLEVNGRNQSCINNVLIRVEDELALDELVSRGYITIDRRTRDYNGVRIWIRFTYSGLHYFDE